MKEDIKEVPLHMMSSEDSCEHDCARELISLRLGVLQLSVFPGPKTQEVRKHISLLPQAPDTINSLFWSRG